MTPRLDLPLLASSRRLVIAGGATVRPGGGSASGWERLPDTTWMLMWPIPFRLDSITCVGVGSDGTVRTTVYHGSRWTVMHCKLLIGSCKFKFDGKKFDCLNTNLIIFHYLGSKIFEKKLKN
jgi:hypothetical protein